MANAPAGLRYLPLWDCAVLMMQRVRYQEALQEVEKCYGRVTASELTTVRGWSCSFARVSGTLGLEAARCSDSGHVAQTLRTLRCSVSSLSLLVQSINQLSLCEVLVADALGTLGPDQVLEIRVRAEEKAQMRREAKAAAKDQGPEAQAATRKREEVRRR
eukprot:4568-Rhodomonas_salina.1